MNQNRKTFERWAPLGGNGFARRLLMGMLWLPWIALGGEPSFEWQLDVGQQAILREGDFKVLGYQIAARSKEGGPERSNYLHPIWDLAGDVVTEDFPSDHYHHRGVFWAWHQLLLNGESLADPWICEKIQWLPPVGDGEWVQTSVAASGARLRARHDWVVPDPEDGEATLRVVRETIEIIVKPLAVDRRVIDIELSLIALLPGISIGGSEDDKAYGGFSPRLRLADDVRFIGQEGEVVPQRTAVKGGAWMNVLGTFSNRRSGVAMMVHPSHPGFPLKWILRAKRSMQNPQWPGRQPVRLSTEEPVRLRYRLVLHNGDLTSEQLDASWDRFARD